MYIRTKSYFIKSVYFSRNNFVFNIFFYCTKNINYFYITSITKYLWLEPFIFSTLPNKLLTFKYKGTTLFIMYSSLYNTYPM